MFCCKSDNKVSRIRHFPLLVSVWEKLGLIYHEEKRFPSHWCWLYTSFCNKKKASKGFFLNGSRTMSFSHIESSKRPDGSGLGQSWFLLCWEGFMMSCHLFPVGMIKYEYEQQDVAAAASSVCCHNALEPNAHDIITKRIFQALNSLKNHCCCW